METGESIKMMMTTQEHEDFINNVFGGGGKFRDATTIKPKSAAEVFDSITSSGYGY
jgi:hypothetical protein